MCVLRNQIEIGVDHYCVYHLCLQKLARFFIAVGSFPSPRQSLIEFAQYVHFTPY